VLPALSVAGARVAFQLSVSTLPLIEPDLQICRIRLSDKGLPACAYTRRADGRWSRSSPSVSCRYWSVRRALCGPRKLNFRFSH